MFSRLVRFVADDGKIYHGDAGEGTDFTHAKVIEGDIFGDYEMTSRTVKIQKLLAPLSRNQLKTVRGIGANYVGVPELVGLAYPKYPLLFYKPLTSVIGPGDDIKLKPAVQEQGLDAEVELVIIIGKEGDRLTKENALDHVLGYTVANDVTHFGWLKRGNMTGALGKDPDDFAPIGPAIVSIADPTNLHLWSKINGEIVQSGHSKDMIFPVVDLLCFLSERTTLLPGDIILSGTPLGVLSSRQPPEWLKEGDFIEVGVDGIGSITNRVTFVKDQGPSIE